MSLIGSAAMVAIYDVEGGWEDRHAHIRGLSGLSQPSHRVELADHAALSQRDPHAVSGQG